jgi:hypothetical protein
MEKFLKMLCIVSGSIVLLVSLNVFKAKAAPIIFTDRGEFQTNTALNGIALTSESFESFQGPLRYPMPILLSQTQGSGCLQDLILDMD